VGEAGARGDGVRGTDGGVTFQNIIKTVAGNDVILFTREVSLRLTSGSPGWWGVRTSRHWSTGAWQSGGLT
jgi:hypothetical protein